MTEDRFTKLEALINRTLSCDADSLKELDALSGKVLSLEFRNTELHFYILPCSNGIQLLKRIDGNVNVRIRGTISDMFVYLTATKSNHDTLTGTLEIIGDAGLAQKFQAIIKSVDIDWEEQLSHITGDRVAHKLGNLCRNTLKFALHVKSTLEADVSEYLRYEKEVLPDRSEVDEYASRVDALRDDVDRLKLRIHKLEQSAVTEF